MIDTSQAGLFRPEALEHHAGARGDTGVMTTPAPRWTRHATALMLAAGLFLVAAASVLPVEYHTRHAARVAEVRPDGLVLALDAHAVPVGTVQAGREVRLGTSDSVGTVQTAMIKTAERRVTCAAESNPACLEEPSGPAWLLSLQLDAAAAEAGKRDLTPGMSVTLWGAGSRQPLWRVVARNVGGDGGDGR